MNLKHLAFVASVAASALLSACSDPNGATRTLEDEGYTNVQATGYDFFGCSNDDFYSTKFTARGPGGRQVSGVVCGEPWFKGNTVRLK